MRVIFHLLPSLCIARIYRIWNSWPCGFFGVSSQPSVTEFRKCDASPRDIGLKAD
jgi:hypothetical protein